MSGTASMLRRCSLVATVAFFLMGGLAQATTIAIDTLSLSGGDPTQLGRLSRTGTPSDWSTPKPFPGTINAGLSYHYTTLTIDLDGLEAAGGFLYGGFVQVDFDSLSTNTFLSAYLDAYNPLSPATNYLGDAGFSGNAFGVDPISFSFIVPSGHDLVLLLNETTPGAGLAAPGTATIEVFSDTLFTDLAPAPAAVPEPGTLALMCTGVATLLKSRRRRAVFRNR